MGAGGPHSEITHIPDQQVDAGYSKKVLVPYHLALSMGLLESFHNMAASFPQSTGSKGEQGTHSFRFYNIALEIIHHYFCSILLVVQVRLTQRGRGLNKSTNTRW